jgi:CheY-like chemotaxis protein
MFLEKLGYFVLAAGSAAEALRLAAAHEGAIDLLVTDVIMPDMNGRQLAEQVLASRPAVKCLFMSGYAADALIGNGDLTKDKHFLLKPFSRDVFARTVRVILEET